MGLHRYDDVRSRDVMISEIYAAAGEPERWGTVLDRCMTLAGAQSGWVNELDRRDRAAGDGLVRNLADTTQQRYFAHFAEIDPFRVDDASRAAPLGLLTDEDFIRRSELLRGEFYSDFLRPLKVQAIAIVRMFDDGAVTRSMHLNFEDARDRTRLQGHAELKQLLPHMMRAASLGRELQRQASLIAALDQFADAAGGVLLLNRTGGVAHASRQAERWLRNGECLVERAGRLRTASAVGAGAFDSLVRSAAIARAGARTGGMMQLPARGRGEPMVVTVTPLDGDAGAPVASVTWRDPTVVPVLCCRETARRFNLTAAEAKVVRLLLEGSTLRQAANRLGLSYHTVRNHMKHVFSKVGVNRQADLVATFARFRS